MRISFVSTMAAVPWGGSEELWHQAALEALKDNHEVLTLTYASNPTPQKMVSLAEKGAVTTTWNLPFRNQAQNISDQVPEYYPYQSLIEWKPDVIVVSHGGLLDVVNGHYLLIELLFRLGIPYFVVVQANTELYKPSDQQRPILEAYFLNAKNVFFVSQANLNLAERQLATKLNCATVINNPVNLFDHSVVPFPKSLSGDSAKLAAVGRLDIYSKGQDVLFQVLGTKKWLDRNWELNLYGCGDDLDYLTKLAQFFGISNRVHFNGQVQNIREIWAKNELLVLPSRIEGTPLVLMEAMLCGRSAVVTDIGGSAEWIEDGVNGFVSKAPFPQPFEEALEAAWTARPKWEDLGRACHTDFLSKHELTPGLTLLKNILQIFPHANTLTKRLKISRVPVREPKFSVIIPCYNYAEFLPYSVGSIINQTFDNCELIIVNDGSTDNSLEVAETLARENPSKNIRIINQKNAGQPAIARNNGIQEARGEYILCLDADDMVDPTMLAKFADAIRENEKISVIYTDAIFFNEESTEIKYSGRFELDLLVVTNQLFCCSLFSKKSWQVAGGFKTNVRGYEDWDFWISLSEQGLLGHKINEPLFYYRTGKAGLYQVALENDSILRANIILNHPYLYTEDTMLQAREILGM